MEGHGDKGMSRQLIIYLDMKRLETRGRLYEVWERLEADRLLESLFYDGSVNSWPDFANEILRPGSLPFVVFRDGEIAAFSWLNNITSRMARTHFAILKNFHGRSCHMELGRHLYSHILTRKDGDGYLFDCLCGITPVTHKLAIKAAARCGWKICGEISEACYIAASKRSVAGVISCATREILGIEKEVGAIWEE